MNRVFLMGRLTKDPEVRSSVNGMLIAKFYLAVSRRGRNREGEQDADFIPCTCFSSQAEISEKYLRKGSKIAITGRINTGSYTNRGGQKVYTTDVIVDDIEFAEGKRNADSERKITSTVDDDGFMRIPDGIEDELPFT